MILNEKRCSGNRLKLAFDCPWKAGFYCRTTTNIFFSKTAVIHLKQLSRIALFVKCL